jgi:hypothetical protein
MSFTVAGVHPQTTLIGPHNHDFTSPLVSSPSSPSSSLSLSESSSSSASSSHSMQVNNDVMSSDHENKEFNEAVESFISFRSQVRNITITLNKLKKTQQVSKPNDSNVSRQNIAFDNTNINKTSDANYANKSDEKASESQPRHHHQQQQQQQSEETQYIRQLLTLCDQARDKSLFDMDISLKDLPDGSFIWRKFRQGEKEAIQAEKVAIATNKSKSKNAAVKKKDHS